jgi:hypothetical protein
MSSWFIHPRYLSAFAAAADRDPDLRKGTHLRLFPSEAIGFPLAPWRLWNLPALVAEVLPVQWFDRRGLPLAAPDLEQAEGEAIGWIGASLPSQARLIGVEVRFAAGGPGEIAVLDKLDDRVVTSRSIGRLLVGAPQINRVRLRGRGAFELLGWIVLEDHVFERVIGSDSFATLSAPLEGDLPWYAGGQGRYDAMQRVAVGAPQRWIRPDRPDGPLAPLSEDAEEARIAVFQPDLDEEFQLLVSDPATMPGTVTRTRQTAPTDPGPWQEVTEQIQGSLLLKSLDPGVGRYAGLLTLLRHLPDMEERPAPPNATVWVGAGLFACTPGARLGLPAADAQEQRLIERLVSLEPSVSRVIDLLRRQHRWTVRAFVTPALAVPVQDAPAPPTLKLGDAAWLRQPNGPSVAFRQQIRVIAPPLATMIALARLESSGWVTRHEMLALAAGSQPPKRAAPKFLGSVHTLSAGRFGVVEEGRVPADGAPWTYQLALSDVFGRFGEPAELQVPVPPRPAIPAPTLRVHLRLADRASHDQPAVAGSVRVVVPVPALVDLAAGARPLARVVASLESASQDSVVSQAGGTIGFEFQLPALLPIEHRKLHVGARFEDDQGNLGTEEVQAIDVTDPRSPPIPKTGIGLVWTSRFGPAEDVEIRVRFTGAPNARYRVYASDARGLDIPLMVGSRPRTRAEIAVDGAQRGLNGLGMRDRFRLVTDEPLKTGTDGSVVFDSRLPRSLETVQFLRFVPLGARGAEAPFENCPLLPVAVPSDRPPPAPRVEVRTDAATGTAEVAVLAQGLDLFALSAAEPGLFVDPPSPGAKPPEFRLRRASGAVANPIYAREIARGVLVRDGALFMAVISDHPGAEGLIPFVRYYYWAEVRMPPERRLPPDTQEIVLPAGAIQPLQPAQRQDAPGAFSLASAPAMTMRVPAVVAALTPEMVTATFGPAVGGWRLAIAITGAPTAHSRAVGGYRVQVHMEREPGFLSLVDEVDLSDGALTWELTVGGAPPASARIGLMLIDPIGRTAAPLFVDAIAT